MPFQFSGAPPALLGKEHAPVNFRSFGQGGSHSNAVSSLTSSPPLPTSSQPVPFGSSAPSASAPCFGQNVFGLSSSPASNFASKSSNAIHDVASDPSNNRPRGSNTTATIGTSSGDAPTGFNVDGLLIRALYRAIRSQPAVMGWREKAADRVLSSLVQTNKLDLGALVASLCALGTGNIASFTLSMFDSMVESDIASCQVSPRSPPRSGEAESLDTENQREERGVASLVGDSMGWTVPRYHRTIVQLEETIAAHVRMHLVHYDEGAKVLSEYVVDQLYDYYDDADIIDDIQEATGHASRAYIARMLQFFTAALRQRDVDFKVFVREGGREEATGGADPSNDEVSSIMSPTVGKEQSGHENSDKGKAPFRFLDLPPELRNWVYIHQLAPQGFIALGCQDSLYKYGADYTASSRCELAVLRTCRQIYKEAKSVLYRENTLLLTAKIEDCHKGIFAHHRLSKTLLSQLASVTMVCNYHSAGHDDSQWLWRALDLRSLQHFTTLKNLRICVLQRESSRGNSNFLELLMKDILDRVPADCEISFESQTVHEIDYTQDLIERQDVCREISSYGYDEVYEVDGALLAELASKVKGTQGCKNGLERDLRFPEKPAYKSVQELIAAGEVDPRMVLGGGQ